MLEADNEDATTSETKEGGGDDQSADDLYAMLNDWGESVGVVPVLMTHVQHDNVWQQHFKIDNPLMWAVLVKVVAS